MHAPQKRGAGGARRRRTTRPHERGDKLRRALTAVSLLHAEPRTLQELTEALRCSETTTKRLVLVLRATPGLQWRVYRAGRDRFHSIRPSWISASLEPRGDVVRQGLLALAMLHEAPRSPRDLMQQLGCTRRTVERVLRVFRSTHDLTVVSVHEGREVHHRVAGGSLAAILRAPLGRP